jgi:hypothetical protein
MDGSNVLLIGRCLDEGKPPKRPESEWAGRSYDVCVSRGQAAEAA